MWTLLPTECILCAARASAVLCAACADDLPRATLACTQCARPLAEHGVCGPCTRRPPPFARCVAALMYSFPVDELIQSAKYRNHLPLARWLGLSLAAAVRTADARVDLVIPVPLSQQRQRERGYNQAAEIGRVTASSLGLPFETRALGRARHTKEQALLLWSDRAANVRGAFAVIDEAKLRGKRVAVVDDVMTTGATMAEIARALLAVGALEVQAWVASRAPPPRWRALDAARVFTPRIRRPSLSSAA